MPHFGQKTLILARICPKKRDLLRNFPKKRDLRSKKRELRNAHFWPEIPNFRQITWKSCYFTKKRDLVLQPNVTAEATATGVAYAKAYT